MSIILTEKSGKKHKVLTGAKNRSFSDGMPPIGGYIPENKDVVSGVNTLQNKKDVDKKRI